MKNKKILILSLAVFILPVLLYLLLFTSSKSVLSSVTVRKGLISFVLNSEAVPVKGGGQGIQPCSFAKKGCQDYINIVPGSKQFESLTEAQKACVVQGCLVWGLPVRKNVNLDLTDEEATSLINDYKPSFLLVRDIKVSFGNGQVLAESLSFFPFAPGRAILKLSPTGPKSFAVTEAYLGRLPLPQPVAGIIQNRLNAFLRYEWMGARLNSLEIGEGKVSVGLAIAPEIIKEIVKRD